MVIRKLQENKLVEYDEETKEWETLIPEMEALKLTEKTNPLEVLMLLQSKYSKLTEAKSRKAYYKIIYENEANALRINVNQIQSEMGISKAPTEKQSQSFIDDQLVKEHNDLTIAETVISVLEHQIKFYEQVLFTLMQCGVSE